MNKKTSIRDQIFGCWKAIKRDWTKTTQYWICSCTICHNIISLPIVPLKRGFPKKCHYCNPPKATGNKPFLEKPQLDLTNKKFGKLTAIFPFRKYGKAWYWHCKCDCGKENDIIGTELVYGGVKSCGCLQAKYGNSNKGWVGYKEISGSFWNTIKKGAKKRNLEFNITIEQIWELFLKQDGKCALTNIDIKLVSDLKRNGHNQTASLDRIDSSKGYTIDNVQWVHKDINRIKQDFHEEYLYIMCKNLINHLKNKYE